MPTVNIGDRQKGRILAESVICCPPAAPEIVKAINKALTPEFKETAMQMQNLFGDGSTSKRILDIILNAPMEKNFVKKSFYDLD